MLTDLIKNNLEIEAIILLKSQHFDLNYQDKLKKTLLMYACEYKMHTLIDALLEPCNKLNINLLDSQDQTALYYACYNQDVKSINKLIMAGIDIDSLNKNLLSVLNFSASHNLNISVSALLKHSLDLNHPDISRKSPLIWACKLNDTNMATSLLEAGADPNKIDENGKSCLCYASDNNNNSMIDALDKFGANINLPNEIGKTVLHYVAQFNKLYVVANLIKKGADINLLDEIGKTPLMHACEQAHMELAKILIFNKAKFSFSNPYQIRGFIAVADNMEFFQFLLSNTHENNNLLKYKKILDNQSRDYSKHISLIGATILNQKLSKKLFKQGHLEDKKSKI